LSLPPTLPYRRSPPPPTLQLRTIPYPGKGHVHGTTSQASWTKGFLRGVTPLSLTTLSWLVTGRAWLPNIGPGLAGFCYQYRYVYVGHPGMMKMDNVWGWWLSIRTKFLKYVMRF
jgi:hypothetical protein